MTAMKISSVVLLAVAFASTIAFAAEQWKVTGQMVINRKGIKLTHVYASAGPSRWHKKKVEIRVILSDMPLSDEELGSGSKREALANAGKLHAMELILADDPTG